MRSSFGGTAKVTAWVKRKAIKLCFAIFLIIAAVICCQFENRLMHRHMSLNPAPTATSREAGPTAIQTNQGGSSTSTNTVIDASNPGETDVTFEVHANQGVHAISPYIYGVNEPSKAAMAHSTVVRLGGNRLTAYNWENNASNAGSDYQFQNDNYMCPDTGCDRPGQAIKLVVDSAVKAGAAALITVPIVDYVAADKNPPGDVRNSGNDYLATRFKQNKAAKSAAFSLSPDISDAFVYQDEMVHWLQTTYPKTTIMYMLDNEPDLWSSTHAEVHPIPVTYAELSQRTIRYASAIKAVAPTALVWGGTNYGWEGYVNLQQAADADHGNFIEYFLDQMSAAGASAGKRLVDGLDLHWYPEATGGGTRITNPGATAELVAAREAAPRSLWDATYTERSWIAQKSTWGPIKLIPLIQAKIAAHYPGTKLSFSEWNYGGGATISGAIATADVLGIFGSYGVDMAEMWPMGDESFTYAAFLAYRNYDAKGKAFGDTSVSATTTDIVKSSIYASTDSRDAKRTVIVVINKASTSLTAGIRVFHPTSYTAANVYTVTADGGASVVAGKALSAAGVNAFKYAMPAQSISVIDLRP